MAGLLLNGVFMPPDDETQALRRNSRRERRQHVLDLVVAPGVDMSFGKSVI